MYRLLSLQRLPAVLLGLAFLAAALPQAALRPLWFDELATHWVASAGDLDAMTARRDAAIEPTPPVSLALTHLSLRLFGDHPGPLRLPAIAGFGLLLASLYTFVSRRLGGDWAATAGGIVLLSGAAYYAAEARPYGMVLGMAGLAAAAWQSYAGQGSRRSILLCGAALFAAGCLHYFAVLLAFPFALAEAVRLWERRRIDWLALAATAAPGLAVAVHLPLIRAMTARAEFSSILWSQPAPGFPTAYWTAALGPASTALVLILLWAFLNTRPEAERTPGAFTRAESALLIGFALLPWIGLAFGYLVTNTIVARYVYGSMIGLAAIAAAALARVAPSAARTVCLLTAALSTGYSLLEARWIARHTAPGTFPVPAEAGELPIVIDDYLRYAELSHYGEASLRRRMFFLTDRQRMAAYTRAGQMELVTAHLIGAGAFTGRTAEAPDFLAAHPRFLLFEPLRPQPQESFMPQALTARGAKLTFAGVHGGGRWYLGESPGR